MIRSFPLFLWAMWAKRSGRSPKMSDGSKSFRLLSKNEQPWAIRSGCSPKKSKWANRSFFCKIRAIRSEIPNPVFGPTHHCYPHCQFLFLLIAAVNIFLFFRLWADSFATEKCSSSRRSMFKSSSSWSGDLKGTVHRDFWPPYLGFFSEHFHMNSLKR